MELNELFTQATISSKNLATKPDNNTLLQLYSLYKQATEGDLNAEPPSNPFDFVAKAKYNAWEALKGKSREESMQEYVNLVNKLQVG